MKKIILVLTLILLPFSLIGCSGDKDFSVPKDVRMLTVAGDGLGTFSETEEQLVNRTVVFEQEKEIEVILKALKDSSPHSGPMNDKGENLRLILSYQDDTSETILLWLYPDSDSGRIQRENDNGPIYLLSQESVQRIAKLLSKQIS